jgi:hypothetical protein
MKSKEELEKIAIELVDKLTYDESVACLQKQIDVVLELLARVQDEALAEYKAFLAGRLSGKHNTMHAQLGTTSEPAPEKK